MTLSWISIIRLGLIQMALGAIVVLTTSTLNRLMVVELALPAVLPGLLVALHYGIQITRPNWGYRSDTGNSRTRWIILGMAALALGGEVDLAGDAGGIVVINRPDFVARVSRLHGIARVLDQPAIVEHMISADAVRQVMLCTT